MSDEPTPGERRWHGGHFQVYVHPPGEWINVDEVLEYDRLTREADPDDRSRP